MLSLFADGVLVSFLRNYTEHVTSTSDAIVLARGELKLEPRHPDSRAHPLNYYTVTPWFAVVKYKSMWMCRSAFLVLNSYPSSWSSLLGELRDQELCAWLCIISTGPHRALWSPSL